MFTCWFKCSSIKGYIRALLVQFKAVYVQSLSKRSPFVSIFYTVFKSEGKAEASTRGNHGYEVLAPSYFLASAYDGEWPVISLVISSSHQQSTVSVLGKLAISELVKWHRSWSSGLSRHRWNRNLWIHFLGRFQLLTSWPIVKHTSTHYATHPQHTTNHIRKLLSSLNLLEPKLCNQNNVSHRTLNTTRTLTELVY